MSSKIDNSSNLNSFPTTLQLRPADTKLEFWRSPPIGGGIFPSPSPGPGSISASPSSSCQVKGLLWVLRIFPDKLQLQPSPFHCAPNTSQGSAFEDLQPMNIIRDGENKQGIQHYQQQHYVQQNHPHHQVCYFLGVATGKFVG